MNAELQSPESTPASAISADRKVIKRDGSVAPFELNKVTRAIALAFFAVRNEDKPNPDRNDILACFGLDGDDFAKAVAIAGSVQSVLELHYRHGKRPTVEHIQDIVEKQIAAAGCWEVAREFIAYRTLAEARRLVRYEDNGLVDFIAASKYARYRSDLGRRETLKEAIRRVRGMHLEFFADKTKQLFPAELPADVAELAGTSSAFLKELLCGRTLDLVIRDAFDAVSRLEILPSMRSMQFGGPATLKNNARMFNCAFSPVDRIDFFKEYFFLLLSGTGCGFSVQKHHVALLPPLPPLAGELDRPVSHFAIEDTIEGWANAAHALVTGFLEGKRVEFNFSQIRPRGAALKTSGGKAPGHVPLKKALGQMERILEQASGRQMKPIEVYDICMFLARAVLSGGVRRSATICLFSPDDEDMMNAKTGDWFDRHPQRSASNNSAVIPRTLQDPSLFRKLFHAQKEFGEPGFFLCDDQDGGTNPCCEIGLHPIINFALSDQEKRFLSQQGRNRLDDLFARERMSGWQMCNLTTINGAASTDENRFFHACIRAAVIGTMQAAYTKIPFLGAVTQVINERDALLGVSICGFMDNPRLLCREDVLTKGAKLVRATNAMMADLLGIHRAARCTCVKPEGTASLLLGAASGIHPHHSQHYFRHVQANRKDPVYQHFHATNPQMTEPSVYNPAADDVVIFPVAAPRGAILRDQITAVEFLELVRRVQTNWVLAGADPQHRSPGINHNVSNTTPAKPQEWEAVETFIWENRQFFTGVSLFAYQNDQKYAQAPRQAVGTDEDVARWNRLQPQVVDYTQMREGADKTALQQVVACGGNGTSCDIVRV